MIEIKQLSKLYGKGTHAVQALDGVDLQIDKGMFGLLGPNGAGKTTLMRIVAGIIDPSRGQVKISGIDLATEKGKQAVKSILGYLPQELGLYPDLSARQFVEYMAILKKMDDAGARQKRVAEVLDLVGLSKDADRKLKSFSGGMKRRVGIAQALVNDPQVLIVDEPTSGLDPEERIRFRNLLVNLALDRTVILSTHIVEDIGQTCQDLAVLSKGHLLFRGSPVELTQAAQGKVWAVTTPGPRKPDNGLTVVSMLHMAEGVHYRLVGEDPSGYPDATSQQPGLEDGYIWLMKRSGQSSEMLAPAG